MVSGVTVLARKDVDVLLNTFDVTSGVTSGRVLGYAVSSAVESSQMDECDLLFVNFVRSAGGTVPVKSMPKVPSFRAQTPTHSMKTILLSSASICA